MSLPRCRARVVGPPSGRPARHVQAHVARGAQPPPSESAGTSTGAVLTPPALEVLRWRSSVRRVREAPMPEAGRPVDDLAPALTNVAADARPGTRAKIANSPETRAFLELGLQLLRDDLLDHRGPDLQDDHDAGTRLFTGLSQARLRGRAEPEGPPRDHP